MSGSSQGSGDQGIDQILAQIRKVIADEPMAAQSATGATPKMPSLMPSANVAGATLAIPAVAKPAIALAKPAAAAKPVQASVTAAPAKPLPPTGRRHDDLSDLVETALAETGPTKAPIKPAAQTNQPPLPVAVASKPAAKVATPPVPTAPIAKPAPAAPPAAKTSPVPTISAPSLALAAKPEVRTQTVPPTAKPAPVPQPLPAKTSLPAAQPVARSAIPPTVRALSTPPLLGEQGGGGKAPMSLANMVANGSISMPSGVPSSVQPPAVRALPSSATAMPLAPSSALGELAAGLAATGQTSPKSTTIPAGLEDQILEGLRPTVRQWLETNAESLAKGALNK